MGALGAVHATLMTGRIFDGVVALAFWGAVFLGVALVGGRRGAG